MLARVLLLAALAVAVQACSSTCALHGECVDSKCKCRGLWSGESCDEPVTCPGDCVVNGEKRGKCVADGARGVCTCLARFTGPSCEKGEWGA